MFFRFFLLDSFIFNCFVYFKFLVVTTTKLDKKCFDFAPSPQLQLTRIGLTVSPGGEQALVVPLLYDKGNNKLEKLDLKRGPLVQPQTNTPALQVHTQKHTLNQTSQKG